MRGSPRVMSLLPSVGFILLILLLLQMTLPLAHVPGFIVPLPSTVLGEFYASRVPWAVHTWVTLSEILTGYLLAVVGGILLAVCIVLSRPLRAVVEPIIVAAQVVPRIAFVPILFLWLGLNPLPRILTVFIVCFFPIVIDTTTGLALAEEDMVDLVRSFDPSELVLLVKARLPSALPSIFSGLKVGAALAVGGAVVSEFVSSSQGLGFLILSSQVTLNTPLMFAAASLLILLGFTLYGTVSLAEKLLVPWRSGSGE